MILDQLRRFEADGYVVLPRAVPPTRLARWRSLRFLTELGFYDVAEFEDDSLIDVALSGPHLPLVTTILGTSCLLDDCLLKVFPPAPPDQPDHLHIDWHRDRHAFFPRGGVYQPPTAVSALVYLQDLTDETGPLRVIPGSHRRRQEVPADRVGAPHPQEELVRPRAGDLVLFHNALLHAGSPNRSGRRRSFVSFSYCLPGLPTSLRRGPRLRARASSARGSTRRLLGADPLAPAVHAVCPRDPRTWWSDPGELRRRWIHDADLRDLIPAPAPGDEAEARRVAALRRASIEDRFGETLAWFERQLGLREDLLDSFDRAFPCADRAPAREAERFVTLCSQVLSRSGG